MSNIEPTPLDAIRVLDQATLPANAGKLNRGDYANVQKSLEILAQFIDAHTPKPEAPKPEPAKKAKP